MKKQNLREEGKLEMIKLYQEMKISFFSYYNQITYKSLLTAYRLGGFTDGEGVFRK